MELNFSKCADGLIPAIAQDYQTGEVLMLAYINQESWAHTLKTGKATYWSRSRQELWVKGDTSSNVQWVKEILVDCDADAVIFKIDQVGQAACHTGMRTCFYRRLREGELEEVGTRVFDPAKVYRKS